MPTQTFDSPGEHQWTVPNDTFTVTIRCWGASGAGGGGSGNSNSSGNDGGWVRGDLDVTPGDIINAVVAGAADENEGGSPNGAHGGAASHSVTSGVFGGGGGGSSDVRHNGDTVSDIVILAGGGGGGGAAFASNGSANTGAGGAGGGSAQDGESAGGASGGTGGGSGSFQAEQGHSDQNQDDENSAAGGGGGGGFNGGGGGGAIAGVPSDAGAAGGGGGDGYTGGVDSTSSATGVRSGDGEVTITYTVATPQSLSADVDPIAPGVSLSWSMVSGFNDSGFEFPVYRDTSENVSTTSGNRVTTVTDNTARSYTDTPPDRGEEYYYVVTARDASTGNESTPSPERSVDVPAIFSVAENGAYTEYPVAAYTDGEWSFSQPAYEYNEGTDTWERL